MPLFSILSYFHGFCQEANPTTPITIRSDEDFMIMKKTDWKIDDFLKKARIKFDWLQFGSQLIKVRTLKDDPILIGQKFDHKKVVSFFEHISKEIGSKALEK